MTLNNSVLHKRNTSTNDSSLLSKTPSNTRLFMDYTEEESMILANNQSLLRQDYTTLRQESYKTKVSRLEMLREISEK